MPDIADSRPAMPCVGRMTVHSLLQLAAFWAVALVTLSAALVLLNIYSDLLGSDVAFRSLGHEATIAGVASLIEGGSAWVVLSFIPLAARALVFPVLVVAIIYKVAHFEDWIRYHILLLFLFQLVLGATAACFYFGRFSSGLTIILIAAVFLAILAAVVRNV